MMKKLLASIIFLLISNYSLSCNEISEMEKYKNIPELAYAINQAGININEAITEQQGYYKNMVPYINHLWNPKITKHVMGNYVCTGDGVSQVTYKDGLPFIVTYCKVFPEESSEDVVLNYFKLNFTKSEPDRAGGFFQWKTMNYHVAHKDRYYEVDVWVSEEIKIRVGKTHKETFNPQIQIKVIDNTIYYYRQKKCLEESKRDR